MTYKNGWSIVASMRSGKITITTSDLLKNPKCEVLLLFQFESDSTKNDTFTKVDQKLGKRLSKKAEKFGFKGEKNEHVVLHDVDSLVAYDAVVVCGLGKKDKFKNSNYYPLLSSSLSKIASLKFKSVALDVLPDVLDDNTYRAGRLTAESFYLSQYRFDKYKSASEKKKNSILEELVVGLSSTTSVVDQKAFAKGVEFGACVADGVWMSRDLVNEPALFMSPEKMAEEAKKIATQSKGAISIKILGRQECENLGMGSYLSVAKGSETEPQFIILHYKGDKAKKSVCLVGKSITFDSGGLSLKPSKHMETMKLDMAGGACVLGIFHVLGKTRLDTGEVYGILPACENMPSGKASRPGDIVYALNKKSIEILNTDAEGRLALADALSYAEKFLKPDYMIDIATLTGAIMVALGPDITGIFGNNEALAQEIYKTSQSEGEDAWIMPMHQPYMSKMKGGMADLKNVTGMGYGGAITAALFLSEFVEKTPWLHLDIAGSSFNESEPTPTRPRGGTGWGIRTILSWLLSHDKKNI